MTTANTRKKRWSFSTTSLTAGIATLCSTELRTPTVFYTREVQAIIQLIVANCEKEVGWWGYVETLPSGDYLITEIFVPEQIVTGTETDISPMAMAALANTLMEQDKDPGKLFYWGHSHVNMGVSPSAQDETQVEEYLDNLPVFIRGIYNKSGSSKVDVYDRAQGVAFNAVPAGCESPLTADMKNAILEILKTNVRNPPVTTVTNYPANNTTQKNSQKGNVAATGGQLIKTTYGTWVHPQTVIGLNATTGMYRFSSGGLVSEKDITLAQQEELDEYLTGAAYLAGGYN